MSKQRDGLDIVVSPEHYVELEVTWDLGDRKMINEGYYDDEGLRSDIVITPKLTNVLTRQRHF
jgi:hypothetical protein